LWKIIIIKIIFKRIYKLTLNNKNIYKELQNGVVLAELGGYADGKFCAIHGKDSALVMLGTYIVDDGDNVDYPSKFVFKPGYNNYLPYLEKNILKAKESNAKVGISVVSVDIIDTVEFLEVSQKSGADFASLCAHSTMQMFLKNNVSSSLLLKRNWNDLRKWISKILEKIKIPVIFKIGAFDNPDIFYAIKIIIEEGIPIIHINILSSEEGSKGLEFLMNLNKEKVFVIAGGGVKDINGAHRIMNTGVNAVSIGTEAIKKPEICGIIQKLLLKSLKK
jgi:tRNA-dihydrouridine synthase